MNKERRVLLAEAVDLIEEVKDHLQGVIDEEQDSYDNLPDGLQCSKTGESIQSSIDKLNGFYDELTETQNKIEKMSKNKK